MDASKPPETMKPRVLIISHFEAETNTWLDRDAFKWHTRRIPVPGLLPQFPDVIRSHDGLVCLVTTGMGLVNAAITVSALLSSPLFNLTKAYFLIAGIGGINPNVGTIGDVVLAKYVVQVDLQYELDAREKPSGWTTGYFPLGASSPTEAPGSVYGTEVFELDEDLRDEAFEWMTGVELLDADKVRAHCQLFDMAEARRTPAIIKADVASSNVFFHGSLLSKTFGDTVKLYAKHFAHGDAVYAITAQEDSGTLAALHRASLAGKLQISRIMLLRTASNFDQPPPGELIEIPIHKGHGGFELSIENLYRSGIELVRGILRQDDDLWA